MKLKKLFSLVAMAFLLVMTFMPYQMANAAEKTGNPTTGSLTIHKFEVEPGFVPGEGNGSEQSGVGGNPLQGVKFEIIQTHAYNATTGKWEAVTNEVKQEKVTGQDGLAVFSDLPLGRYTV